MYGTIGYSHDLSSALFASSTVEKIQGNFDVHDLGISLFIRRNVEYIKGMLDILNKILIMWY